MPIFEESPAVVEVTQAQFAAAPSVCMTAQSVDDAGAVVVKTTNDMTFTIKRNSKGTVTSASMEALSGHKFSLPVDDAMVAAIVDGLDAMKITRTGFPYTVNTLQKAYRTAPVVQAPVAAPEAVEAVQEAPAQVVNQTPAQQVQEEPSGTV